MVVFTNVAVSNRIAGLLHAGNWDSADIGVFSLAFDKLYLKMPQFDCSAGYCVGKSRR